MKDGFYTAEDEQQSTVETVSKFVILVHKQISYSLTISLPSTRRSISILALPYSVRKSSIRQQLLASLLCFGPWSSWVVPFGRRGPIVITSLQQSRHCSSFLLAMLSYGQSPIEGSHSVRNGTHAQENTPATDFVVRERRRLFSDDVLLSSCCPSRALQHWHQ